MKLDVKGLQCPLPVLRAGKVLKTMQPGEELTIQATDPAARADFAAFCETTGCVLISIEESAGILTISLRKPQASQ